MLKLKKLIIFIFSCVLIISTSLFFACGTTTTDNKNFKFTLLSNDTYSVALSNFEFKGKIYIPENYEGKPVTEIAERGFEDSKITEVNLPSTIKKINFQSFAGCTLLKKINIPNNVNTIGVNAFNGCESLETINIPLSVTSIGTCAFYYCKNLKTLYYEGTEAQYSNVIKYAYGTKVTDQNTKVIYLGDKK